ncbi:unnamed protein product, partial [Tetraodon nigroviridis]
WKAAERLLPLPQPFTSPLCSRFGILERCKELVEAGYDVRQPDKENVTLLHWAAINNRSELVKYAGAAGRYYISKGAIVDQLGGDLSSTPLHWAIRQGHLSMVIQLLRYGADPSIADGEGYRALHLAILFQHMAIAAYLMAKGQDVDEQDANGQTPVMLAALKIIGPEPTKFLVKNNASLSAVDKVNRNTPLHCAVLAGNVDAAHILLEGGASVDAENLSGHTPIDLAHQVHSPLLVHMLNHVKQERIRSNSRCLRVINRYRPFLQFLLCVALLGSVGAILDMDSESWLLKGFLLACVIGGTNVASRNFASPAFESLLPCASLMASVFWMLVTWFLWFLPNILLSTAEKGSRADPRRALFALTFDPTWPQRHRPERAGVGRSRLFQPQSLLHVVHGARNHHYYVLFLLSLTLMGSWMFYGCFVRECAPAARRRRRCGSASSRFRLPFRLGHPLSAAVRRAGPVGRRLRPGGLLAVAALRLLPGLLPHLLVLLHPAGAALPGDASGTPPVSFPPFRPNWSGNPLTSRPQIAVLGLTSAERTTLALQQRRLQQPVSLRQNPYNLGVLRNLVSFFQLRCCGLFKPAVIDWTQQLPHGPDHLMFAHADTV